MSRQLVLVLIAVVGGFIAGFFSAAIDLKVAADKAPVVIAVFMAALFVRLARGVPTFPFEKLPQRSAEAVLIALVHLRGMYALAFGSFMAALVAAIAYTPLIESTAVAWLQAILTGVLAALLIWAVETAYLIYRTDMALFKAQTRAVQTVVDLTAGEAAATSLETVRKSLAIGDSAPRKIDPHGDVPRDN
jgi:hypothetical protein